MLRSRPRWLLDSSRPAHEGIQNIVVDSASIEVSRRKRRAKSDRLDAVKLVSMLIRWHNGEKKVWSVVHVPTVDDEDRRQLHRELIEVKAERTELINRIKGLLAGLGLSIVVDAKLPGRLEKLRQWDKHWVPPALQARILREFERWQLVVRQISELETERAREIRTDKSPQGEQTRRLMSLKGIGANGAWLLVREFFGWRQIRNRRELASLAGLTPTPYDSGEQPARARHQQGRQPTGAVDDGPVGMGLAAAPAPQRIEQMVPTAIRRGEQPDAQGGDRGPGAKAVGCVVEISRDRRTASRSGGAS